MSDPGPATVRLTDAAPGRGATGIELDQLPEQLAQNLVKTLRLGVRYNKSTNKVRCRITLTGTTVTAAPKAADPTASAPRREASDPIPPGESASAGSAPILVVPPEVPTGSAKDRDFSYTTSCRSVIGMVVLRSA